MISKFGEQVSISNDELQELVFQCLDKVGKVKKVLILPPDHTRLTLPRSALGERPQLLENVVDAFDQAGAVAKQLVAAAGHGAIDAAR